MSSRPEPQFDGMGRINGRKPRPYVMIDYQLIELLDSDELALYVVLMSFLRSPERMTDRECWPSHEELARVYGRSVDAVQRVMKKLVTRGLVVSTRRGKTKSNRYRLAATLPGMPTSDTAFSRHHSGSDTAETRSRDAADLRSRDAVKTRQEVEEGEVDEEKEKNYPPGSSNASLSPSVPRAPAHTERERLIIQLASDHAASTEEVEGAWLMASKPDFPGADEYRSSFRDWFKAWVKEPDEVAQDIANYRDKLRCDAEHEERQRLATRPRPECAACRRPFARQPPGRDIPPGTVCTECAA